MQCIEFGYVVQVAAGGLHNGGLQRTWKCCSGRVESHGQRNVSGCTNIEQVTAGLCTQCLKAHGTVVAVGSVVMANVTRSGLVRYCAGGSLVIFYTVG